MSKKINIIVLLVLLVTLFTVKFNGNNLSVNAQDEGTVHYLHANYAKNYDSVDLLDEFDYSFVGEIDSFISTSQYNGYGTDIPYSYFYVDILEEIKGNIEDNIIIKFYGGYNTENNLILFENMPYPQIDETYLFHCNKTNSSYAEDGRTIDNSYVIIMEQNMQILGDASDQSNDNQNEILSNNFIGNSISPDIFFEKDDGSGGGGHSNTSFSNATTINVNSSVDVYLYSGEERYYKTSSSSLSYLSVYSAGTNDTMIEIYDSNYQYVDDNDDVNVSDTHGRLYASGRNFFLNFYANKSETYYFKVKYYSPTVSGNFTLNLIQDNWIGSSNISDLLWEYDGVDGKNKVDYTIKSRYLTEIGYAFNEWNKLEKITFSPDTGSTTNDITVSDMFDNETGSVIAVTTYNWIFTMTVKFNTFYFDTMTQDQRIHTCLHEFGHVLGLNEFTGIESTNNVMHQGMLSLTKLGPADIAAYREKWGY